MKKIVALTVVLAFVFGLASPVLAEGPEQTAKQVFGKMTAIGYSDGSVKVENGYGVTIRPVTPNAGSVKELIFRPDGKYLAVVYDQVFTFVDLMNLASYFEPVRIADGCRIVAAAYDLVERQTAVFAVALNCGGRWEFHTWVWAPGDAKEVVIKLPDAR